MSTDRELLELAAKAAEIQIQWHRWPSTARETAYVPNGDFSEQHDVCYSPWNPLTDDGDAFWLAVKLELPIAHHGKRELFVQVLLRPGLCFYEPHGDDKNAATRRAIVRAAAAIAEAGSAA